MTQGDSPRKPVEKRPIDSRRVRRIGTGFSWIDRRFVREHASELTRDEILLYFFLVAVADRDGLSFYGDATAAGLLKVPVATIRDARSGLIRAGLVAYRAPLYQVLELPAPRSASTGPSAVADVLREILEERGG